MKRMKYYLNPFVPISRLVCARSKHSRCTVEVPAVPAEALAKAGSERSESVGRMEGNEHLSTHSLNSLRSFENSIEANGLNKILLLLFLLITNFVNSNSYTIGDFKLGVENISDALVKEYSTKNKPRIGLITNQTGKDQKGNRTVDILRKKGFNIVYLFCPEHGFNGDAHAAQEIKNGKDVKTGIAVISMYGKGSGKKIDQDILNSIDAFFFDIQDSGMRHYTYISSMFRILQAAQENHKKVVIFDRPNPLGKVMEGPLVEPELISFISIAPIPLRHGMTIGELAEYFNTYLFDKKVALTVVPMNNYDRTMGLMKWIAPLSPNIACLDSCHGYSFLGLLGEVRPFDVGVGTPHAFQIISLPESLAIPASMWIDLAKDLKMCGVSTIPWQSFNERKKELYHGLRLQNLNVNQVSSFNAFLATLHAVKKMGISIEFAINFDKAAGTVLVRRFLAGTLEHQEFMREINYGLQTFFQKAQAIFKYMPHPELLFN